MNTSLKVAIGTVAVVAVAIIGVNLLSDEGSTVGGAGSTPHPAPSPTTASLPAASQVVHGWVPRGGGPAGIYSWDASLKQRWMHNPNDRSGGVSITFSASTNDYESGPNAVIVAGYDGTYQELPTSADGTRTELWIVDIEDTRVTITVGAHRSSTEAELAEAHAVIGSIRSEPWEGAAGFRLTFTLPDGWDSG